MAVARIGPYIRYPDLIRASPRHVTDEQRQRLRQRSRERIAQMPERSPDRNQLFDILLRLSLGETARNIHMIHRTRNASGAEPMIDVSRPIKEQVQERVGDALSSAGEEVRGAGERWRGAA
jgi:hypothetical protein